MRPDPARKAAAALVRGVLEDRRMLSANATGLDGAEAARALSLARLTLRWLKDIDTILARHMKKAPPARALAVLQVATAELRHGGVPPHAAVDAAVRLIRADRKVQHLSGLANAVLRKVAIDDAPKETPRLPRWLRSRLTAAWGADATRAMERIFTEEPPVDLTLRKPVTIEGAAALPTGGLRLVRPGQITNLPGYRTGDWWVQDAAAALPMWLLGDVAEKRVLDLCAAPGGKTMQLAAAGAEVTALDLSDARLERLKENLARTQLSARIVVADALEWEPDGPFDAILLDAPCSATGTIRRHPELPYLRGGADISALVTLQSRLLDRALDWLAPEGALVYCTCSILPEEGEGQIAAALKRHPHSRIRRPERGTVPDTFLTDEGTLRTLPNHWAERGGIDGFFAACLTRDARAESG